MSGSDRGLIVQRRVNRLTRTGTVKPREPMPQRDAPRGCEWATEARAKELRDIKLTRTLAVEALGAERVIFAERLRAKGWSVTGIARHVAASEATIRALFGLSAGCGSAPEGATQERGPL